MLKQLKSAVLRLNPFDSLGIGITKDVAGGALIGSFFCATNYVALLLFTLLNADYNLPFARAI